MINLLTASDPFIIGHTPPPPFARFALIRAPEFLPDSLAEALFANNWPYWLAAALIGAAAIYVGRTRGNKTAARSGLAILAATAVWIALALLIATPQERLDTAQRSLLDAAAARDVDALTSHFSSDFLFPALNIGPDNLRARLDLALKTYPIRANYITSAQTRRTGNTAVTTLTILTEFESLPPTRTKWEFRWIDQPNADWRLRFADLQMINDSPASSIPIPSVP